MRTPRKEQLGKRLVAMMRKAEERREELRTWELANINCRVKDIIEGVVEGVSSIDNHGNKDEEEPGSNEVEESLDKEVDNEAVDLEESSSAAEEEELETGVPPHLTEAAGTAGFHLIIHLFCLCFKAFMRLSF